MVDEDEVTGAEVQIIRLRVPLVYIRPASFTGLRSHSGGQGSRRSNKLYSCKTTDLRPVEVFLVSVIVDVISQFTGAVAVFAGAVLPGVHPCASALWTEDWIALVHGYFVFVVTLSTTLQHMKAQKPEATHPTSDMIGSLKI